MEGIGVTGIDRQRLLATVLRIEKSTGPQKWRRPA
jgi:hypothetical protein